MLPGFDFLPVEEVLWMKREELMREFQDIRLVRAARIANPSLTTRAWVRVGELLIRAGLAMRERFRRPRQTYLDSAIRFAA